MGAVYAEVLEEFLKTVLNDVFSLRATPGRRSASIISHCRILGSKPPTETGKGKRTTWPPRSPDFISLDFFCVLVVHKLCWFPRPHLCPPLCRNLVVGSELLPRSKLHPQDSKICGLNLHSYDMYQGTRCALIITCKLLCISQNLNYIICQNTFSFHSWACYSLRNIMISPYNFMFPHYIHTHT